jgi:hypothetical protein
MKLHEKKKNQSVISIDDSFKKSFSDIIISEMHPLITTLGKKSLFTSHP